MSLLEFLNIFGYLRGDLVIFYFLLPIYRYLLHCRYVLVEFRRLAL